MNRAYRIAEPPKDYVEGFRVHPKHDPIDTFECLREQWAAQEVARQEIADFCFLSGVGLALGYAAVIAIRACQIVGVLAL